MCNIGSPDHPDPAPPPKPPPPVNYTDPEVARAKKGQRRRASSARGRGSTLLQGQLNNNNLYLPNNFRGRTLLGG